MPVALRPLRWLVPLLLLAAVPVAVVLVRGERWDDCADPEALRALQGVLEGEPVEYQPFYRRHVFQRNEGTLPAGPSFQPFRYRIVRSDEPRYPLEQPTRFLRAPMDPERTVVRRVEHEGQIVPIHFHSDFHSAHFGKALRVAGSLYVYDGQPVDVLLPLQVRSAAAQLVRGRRPITLFQVHGYGRPRQQGELEQRQIDWLLSAWSAYQRVCAPSPAG